MARRQRSSGCNRRAAALWSAALVGAGCGRGVSPNPWPMSDAGDASDAAPDDQPCPLNHAFGIPIKVPGLNGPSTTSVLSVRFTSDERIAYLSQLHGIQVDIYLANRARPADPLGPASPVDELNTNSDDEYPTFTDDTFTIYFASTRSGGSSLFVSSRTATVYKFSDPVQLGGDLLVDSEGAPYVLPDGSALYFHTHRSGNYDIYRAQKNATGFDPAQPLMLNTDADETAPVVSHDELTIYFSRRGDPTGHDGIWMATRDSVANQFGMPVPLDLTAPSFSNATPTWISPDACRLYLQEQDSSTAYWAFVAERTP
ncbi:MAG TPA: hypothetical protein VKQ32_15730 [Polyangia bacterium]|nr:hypothetical protein [Polyangia bacterium]